MVGASSTLRRIGADADMVRGVAPYDRGPSTPKRVAMAASSAVEQGAGLLCAALLAAIAGLGIGWWVHRPSVPSLAAVCETRTAEAQERHGWRFGAADPQGLGFRRASLQQPDGPAGGASASAPVSAADPEAMRVELAGSLRLTSSGKSLRAEESAEAVVYWRPREPVPIVVPEEPLVITTRRKVFLPRSLPVVVGSRVRFPNEDPILHNAFSTSAGNAFDTGLYGAGEGETVRFDQAGLVRVYCNVHQSMVAHVLVLDTPFFARPNRDGRFVLRLPAGPGELFVWHERATLWRKSMNIEGFDSIDVQLDLTRRRVPAHLNKFGKPYRSGGSGYR